MPIISLQFEITPEQMAFVQKLTPDGDAPATILRMALETGLLDLKDEASRVHREGLFSKAIASTNSFREFHDSNTINKPSKLTTVDDDEHTGSSSGSNLTKFPKP